MATIKSNIQNDSARHALNTHLKRVGCDTPTQYRLWCQQNGLRDNLIKNVHEREREVALYTRLCGQEALRAARRFDRHPEEILRALSRGETAGLAVHRRPYLQRIQTLFSFVETHSRTRDAFLRLLLHTHRFADFESDDSVVTRYGRNPMNTYAGGLLSLARRYTDWIREPEAWKPTSHRPRRQFSEFASHLLCHYRVPGFMEAAFFRGDGSKGNISATRPFVDGYISTGRGVSLRQLPLSFTLTKRMAHAALTDTPIDLSVEEGWLWAQVHGQGGDERLARALIATPLGTSLPTDAFWETVILWFVEHPMLDPSRVGPLVDYLRYERYTPHRMGDDRDRLSAGFTMKGRTPTALLTRMEAWHTHLTLAARVAREHWEPSGISEFRQESEPEQLVWTIEEITTAKGLVAEGRAMSHCVATYADNCARGLCSIWSVKAHRFSYLEPVPVMTIAINRNRVITEARGKRNALPSTTPGTSGAWGIRLNSEDAYLLIASRRPVQYWASLHGITLPAYLR